MLLSSKLISNKTNIKSYQKFFSFVDNVPGLTDISFHISAVNGELLRSLIKRERKIGNLSQSLFNRRLLFFSFEDRYFAGLRDVCMI